MNKEIWKDIPNYEGSYQVSNYGRIKSLPRKRIRKTEKVLKSFTNNSGYEIIRLYQNGLERKYLIHRLVAEVFVTNVNNLPQVNHIDGNKHNNNVNNLEWCTASQNMKHSYANGLNKITEKRRKICSKNGKIAIESSKRKVNQYDIEGNFIKTWDSILQIKRKLNIDNSAISKCCKNKRKTAGGYIWKSM